MDIGLLLNQPFQLSVTQQLSDRFRLIALDDEFAVEKRIMEDKLFFVLFYFKCYPTFDLAGLLFDFNRSQANRWLHRLQPILEAALGRELVLPKRQLHSLAEFIACFPETERVILDGVERPIQRPQDPARQTRTYTGKKKRNTRKHLGLSDQDKRILLLSPVKDGSHHDKSMLDCLVIAEHIPIDIPIQVDLGFKGLEDEYENIEIPHKKPRGGELTTAQKEENQAFSGERVVVEHAFGGTKRYRAAADIYRNRKEDFDDRLMVTATTLLSIHHFKPNLACPLPRLLVTSDTTNEGGTRNLFDSKTFSKLICLETYL